MPVCVQDAFCPLSFVLYGCFVFWTSVLYILQQSGCECCSSCLYACLFNCILPVMYVLWVFIVGLFFSYIFDNSCKTSDQQGLVVMVLVVVLFPSSFLFLLLFSFLLLSFLLFFSSSSSPLSSSLLLFLDFWFTSSLCYCYFVIITLLSYQCILEYSRPSIIQTPLVTADSSGVQIIKNCSDKWNNNKVMVPPGTRQLSCSFNNSNTVEPA